MPFDSAHGRRTDLVLFDLDGTLADTSADVAAAMNHVLRLESLPELPTAVITRFVGHGVRRLIQRSMDVLGAPLNGREERMFEAFVAFYRRHMLDRTVLYPGVAETLERMRGVRMAVLTNKPEGPSRTILQGLGAAAYFSALVGGDTLEFKKPDPRTLQVLLDRYDVAPARALMVGDTFVDIATAHAAGARACIVTYGFAYQEDLSAAEHTIDAFAQLLQIV
jgi:phosphoglycolate phosphatase